MRNDLVLWRASAPLLAALVALGVWLESTRHARQLGGYLVFDRAGDALHAFFTLVALVLATGLVPERASRAIAGAWGAALLVLAALGFLSARLFGLGPLVGLQLDLVENALHLALGAWGAKVGFGRRD